MTLRVERARQRLGTTLRSKWRLDALLGIGGMAAVYASTHRNGARAAVKVLHPELATQPDARERFLREGYAANAVGHDGAVRVLDDDVSEDGSLFLVTELLDGETLEDRRVRMGGRLDEDDVLAVTDQILELLVAAHARNIVHLDLKPENVFVTRAGKIKVLDFGTARWLAVNAGAQAAGSGVTMGTPSFMPPEQARGRWDEVDGASDVWALGATMFAALSGRPVHDGLTASDVLLAAMTRSAPPLAAVAPGVSAETAQLVDGALAFDRASRWADARTMQAAVQHARQRRSSQATPVRAARRNPRLAVLAALVGGSLTLGAVGAGTALTMLAAEHHGAQTTSTESVAPTSAAPALLPAVLRAEPAPETSAPSPSPSKVSCSPPYVVDPSTGKRTWKQACSR
jgi:eukaryotic-like serine/threonine-protein kinase